MGIHSNNHPPFFACKSSSKRRDCEDGDLNIIFIPDREIALLSSDYPMEATYRLDKRKPVSISGRSSRGGFGFYFGSYSISSFLMEVSFIGLGEAISPNLVFQIYDKYGNKLIYQVDVGNYSRASDYAKFNNCSNVKGFE